MYNNQGNAKTKPNKTKVKLKMVRKFVTHILAFGENLHGVVTVLTWQPAFPVWDSELQFWSEQKQSYLKLIVYVYPSVPGGYMKD